MAAFTRVSGRATGACDGKKGLVLEISRILPQKKYLSCL